MDVKDLRAGATWPELITGLGVTALAAVVGQVAQRKDGTGARIVGGLAGLAAMAPLTYLLLLRPWLLRQGDGPSRWTSATSAFRRFTAHPKAG